VHFYPAILGKDIPHLQTLNADEFNPRNYRQFEVQSLNELGIRQHSKTSIAFLQSNIHQQPQYPKVATHPPSCSHTHPQTGFHEERAPEILSFNRIALQFELQNATGYHKACFRGEI